MTKKLTPEEKQNRKPIQTACIFCHEKHLQCDIGRPCQNCIKRNIGDTCKDKERKSRQLKRMKPTLAQSSGEMRKSINNKLEISRSSTSVSPSESTDDRKTIINQPLEDISLLNDSSQPSKCNIINSQSDTFSTELSKIPSLSALFNHSNGINMNDIIVSDYRYNINDLKKNLGDLHNIENSDGFGSMWTNNEYMKLNDILNSPVIQKNMSKVGLDSWTPEHTDRFPKYAQPIRISENINHQESISNFPSFPRTNSRPHISLDMANLLGSQINSNNESKISPGSLHSIEEMTPYKFRQWIKTPQELYSHRSIIKSHDYRTAYRDLLALLKERFLNTIDGKSDYNGFKQLQSIAHSMKTHYAPKFVTLTMNLIEDDLYLHELVLQRTLLEYESMIKMVNCTPMCIWRRSGEICFASNEFISLTGFTKKEILSRRRFIMEFLDNESIINYFDIFHQYLAFGSGSRAENTSDGQAIFGECSLLLKDKSFLKCSCLWTVKRDSFNIPMLIMGQFLPIFNIDQN